jgi:hypothetical protein
VSDSEHGHTVVIVERYHKVNGEPPPPGTVGIAACVRCHHRVLLTDREATKVAAGTWEPLCQECGAELMLSVDDIHYVGRSGDPEVN